MRSNEERVTAVKKRLREMERQKRQSRRRFFVAASAAACIFCIAGLSALFPALGQKIVPEGFGSMAMAGSIFSGSGMAGYMVMGVISFVLGVCVAAAAFEMQKRNRQEEQGEDDLY